MKFDVFGFLQSCALAISFVVVLFELLPNGLGTFASICAGYIIGYLSFTLVRIFK
jgi:hypothetical protein